MHKNKSQKPGGCKAAKVLSLDELKKRREALTRDARAEALHRALKFYMCDVDTLRRVVFANWLDTHWYGRAFESLEFAAA